MPEVTGKPQNKTSFKVTRTIESLFTGGKAAITPDEQYLITTIGEDIDVTEIHNGKRLFRLSGDTEIITTFAITPDGKYLISSSRSLSVKIWDLKTGKCVRSFKAHEAPIIVIDVDGTSTLVATGSADSTVKVWDIEGGFCTHNFRGHGGIISSLKFWKESYEWMLISGSDDCNIRVWDLSKRSCVAVLKSHVSMVRGLDITNDGKYLISGSRDKVVNIWDLNKKKLVKTFPIYETIETVGILEPNTIISEVENNVGKELFYTGGDKGIIRIWDLKTGNLIKAQDPEKNTKYGISEIIYLRKSDYLTAVTTDHNILFYNISSGLRRIKQIIGHNDEIIDLVYVGPSESHLAIATNTEQIRLLNVDSFDNNIIYGHKDIVICLSKSFDGRFLMSGSKDNTARLWKINIEANEVEEIVKPCGICVGHTGSIGTVALPNKSLKFCITGSQDRTVKYWDLSQTDLSKCDEEHRPKSLYTHQAHEKDINSISISQNDKMFASGSQDKTIKIWSVADGKLLGTCIGHKRGVWCVQFSPVDQTIVSSSGDKNIKIWSINDFSCLKTFEGHTNTVLKVSFITSGLQLISSGSDGLVKLWNVKSNECVTTLDNHTEKIWSLTIRKDEKFVASGGGDSLINIWQDCTAEEMETRVKEEEEFILKEQELSNYMLKKDYKNAITLAISLNQPFKLLKLFTEVLKNRVEGDDSITGSESTDKIIATLSMDNLEQILKYIRDWNTNAKNYHTTQTILYAILKSFSSQDLLKINGIKDILDGMLSYTERHYQRLDRLVTDSYIIDYSLHSMDLLDPLGQNLMED
ncbi:17730_t:CDS:10 [Funneliformis geosporum]|uniref:8689_t:CDS:1 n=1 Tax=Funneliformis geosporum TaxID=1117311 RepID=A0A9W4SEK7_9GLOM|nr:17730_t:CDS:10 [Funneliformis geosporum]CAI2166556.1 8689_t:CDS:10 [Funneliformis geosporum]